MSVEVVALGVGRSVAKLVASRWMSSRAIKPSATLDLVDLIKTGFPDEIKRRKAERQFEAIADAVTERVLTVSRQEFTGLREGDREAVLYQIALTLDRVELTDKLLLVDDVDPVKIARRLRATVPARRAESELGEAGTRLYEVVLDESCDCIARIVVHLPQFEPRALAETLARLSQLTDSVETALARLPVRTLMAPDGESGDEEFARRYLTAVTENMDTIELFGIRFERFARPQTVLSVAYVSLSVSQEDSNELDTSRAARSSVQSLEVAEDPTIRVESALGKNPLMLIRGEAGGGKSTLLRWLAVTAARSLFFGDLAGINGYIPILIKLRSHADAPLPKPEEFIDGVAGNLVGIMPRGWVHRILTSGRAILLIDGVDEITSSQRQVVRSWIKGIISEFPSVRIVVTSRPAAAAANWLRTEGFSSAFLEQLGPADLRALIRHWHQAVRNCDGLPCPPDRLPSYEAKLLARFESSPHLKTLASTPLLAAMLCALNLDRDSLPRNRMSLYAAALDMLLETRDATRNVPSAREVSFEREQKVRILQDLAWHLSASGRVELPKNLVERLIAERLNSMPRAKVTETSALDVLLHRSGVIREPIPGRVDFVHRTVQEYLAAKQVADLGDMDILIRGAHLAQWRETVIMAAGHANDPLRRELIMGLLSRVKAEPRNARRIKLLAVACLETLPAIPDDLRIELDECLDSLIPPRDDVAARSLATAGEPVLQRLPLSLENLSDRAATATIQTAWLINGRDSLDVLARYVADHRYHAEISRAWRYYDAEEYAKVVLSAMTKGGDVHVIDSAARVAALRHVPPLSKLEVNADEPDDMSFLNPHAASLTELTLYYGRVRNNSFKLPLLPNLKNLALGLPGMSDLSFLDDLPQLGMIWLTSCSEIKDYGPLRRFANLTTLILFGSKNLRDVRSLPELGSLRSLGLDVSRLGIEGFNSILESARELTNVYVDGGAEVFEDLATLGHLKLHDLRVTGGSLVADLEPLRAQTGLWFLDLSRSKVSDLSPLSGLRNLVYLRLRGCRAVSDLRPLASLPNLRELMIEGVAPGVDLSPLSENRRLEVLISSGQDVHGIEKLKSVRVMRS